MTGNDPEVCRGCGGKAADGVCLACGGKPGQRGGACRCDVIDPKGRTWRELERAGTSQRSDTHSDSDRTVSETRRAADQGKDARPDTSDGSDRELLAGVRDGSWLSTQEFAPLAYAVPGLIPEGLTLEVGPPKAGKSWLTLGLLLAVASGGVALGSIKASPPRRVLYLALEDGDRRMQDRCRALLGQPAIPGLFSYQTRIVPGMVLPTIAAWMRLHPDTAMIVVDTLGKVMPPALQGESAYQRDYRVGAALKAQADAHEGLSVVVLHHDRKANSEDFVDSVSGTHGLAGAADTIMVLCRARQSSEGSLKITGRDVPENEYALKVVDGKAWQLDGDSLAAAAGRARKRDDGKALGETAAKLLAVIRKHPEGIRASDLIPEFGKDVYTYLSRLTDAGRIDKVARGLYVPLQVSEPSEVSDSQFSGDDGQSDSAGQLSETQVAEMIAPFDRMLAQKDPDAAEVRPPCEHEECWDALAGRCLGETWPEGSQG